MTDRWLNYVLSVVVVLGLIGVAQYNEPRDRAERAEFLDQELTELAEASEEPVDADRDPVQLRRQAAETAPDGDDDADAEPGPETPALGVHGVAASHPAAVEVGMQVLDAGGNAVDAAIAVAYALGVAEPFGSGIGGGGSMLIVGPGEDPRYYDYREIAPVDGPLPNSDIGVPGFVAGMAHIGAEHGTVEVADLIEYAARLAEDGIEVDAYLNERLEGAAHRMPIHLLPAWFPDGVPVGVGTTLRQPEYAEALRLLQEDGPDAMYRGALAEQIVDAVSGLELEDFEAYEVLELEPAVGTFAGRTVVSGGAPVSGQALIQTLQIADTLGITDLDLASADAFHVLAQAWRQAAAQRTTSVADPTIEDVDLDALLDPELSAALAAAIPDDGFVPIEEDGDPITLETDTTHVVVVDDDGTMVSMTNTLSNFFGSGLPVSGFFLNDQLKNFSADPDNINHQASGKRPRSFITPTVVLDDEGRPELGLGTPGGRRIPNITTQVLVRWAGHGEGLAEAIESPRFHVERGRLEVEESLPGSVSQDLTARGYEVTTTVPTTEYYGGVVGLLIDWESGTLDGAEDIRRVGTWASNGG
jgi:gamma-glutamyltranspeptidase / glutathione hydrolase